LEEFARRLLGDVHRAEDLTQEVFLAALQRPVRAVQSPAAWLAGVLKNLARQSDREEGRRRRREERVARSVVDDPERRERRFAAMRTVVDALDELREPYRSTLLMRFFEGWPPREIARRTGVPVRTVHTRVTRGLALMRERLDEASGGDRAVWTAALGAWLPGRSGSSSAVSAGVGVVAAAGVAVLAGAALWSGGLSWPAVSAPHPSPVESVAAGGSTELAVAALSAPRTSVAPKPVEVQPAPSFVGLRGSVVDLNGEAVRDVPVRFEPGELTAALGVETYFETGGEEGTPLARTDEAGGFEAELAPVGKGRLVAGGDRFAPVVAAMWPVVADAPVLVVGRRTVLVGRVEDLDGEPLEGALVRLLPAESFEEGERRTRGSWMCVEPRARTDAEGHFALAGAYAQEGARLRVTRAGFVAERRTLDGAGPWDVRVAMTPEPAEVVLRGRVLTPAGEPAPEAVVAVGLQMEQVGADGGFTVRLPSGAGHGVLRAIARGHLPASFEATRDEAGAFVWPSEITLELGGEPLAIEGRVLDLDGNPLSGAGVWAADPTPFGDDYQPWFAENFLHGVEHGLHVIVTTDADGRFRLPALLDREYVLRAADLASLVVVEGRPVPAGSRGVELRLATGGPSRTLVGRVVGFDGSPVVGGRVRARREFLRSRFPDGTVVAVWGDGASCLTDSLGRFALSSVSPGLVLQVTGPGIALTEHPVPPADETDTELVVPRTARLQVTVGATSEATLFRLFDLDGNLKTMVAPRNNANPRMQASASRAFLRDGRSNVLLAPEGAHELVLFDGDRELAREPITLFPDVLHEIDLREASAMK